jgi:type VI secretion system secreted protein VgrG
MSGRADRVSEVVWRFAAGRVDAEAWTVVHLDAREAMSDLFHAQVVLMMESGGGGLDELLGARASLDMHRGPLQRRLRGVVSEVEELGTTAQQRFVRVDVVPALWTLSERSDCRIFQGKSTVEIVRTVLADAGVYQGAGELRIDSGLESYAPREYCVQYRETDLAFVRRLLEDDGVPFYFAHDGERGEALVLAADDHDWHAVEALEGETVRVLDAGTATSAAETLTWFDERHTLRPTSVTVRDFDFTRPRAAMDMTGRHGKGVRSLFEYPARATITGYDEGSRVYKTHNTARLAKVRAEEHLTRVHRSHGRGNVTGMTPGRSFVLAGHERPELDRRYLVTSVEHQGHDWHHLPDEVRQSGRFRDMLADARLRGPDDPAGDGRYSNRVECHRVDENPASVPFRPARVTPRPIVEGPQTARVVGPPGEEIHTDPHGRVKVQFHWDRQGREDDQSSCWMRVAQTMGGGNWGFVFIPRIGMEAVVSFLEGDPDRPLVAACVFNGENQPPYALPENKTRTSLKTNSTPTDGGYNEMRFEDMKGLEQLFMQAQRNMDTLIKNDETHTVNNNRSKLVQGEELNTIEKNRMSRVMQNDLLAVDGNHEMEVHGGQGQSLTVDNDRQVTVGGNQSTKVDKNANTVVTLCASETVGVAKAVQVGAAYQVTVGMRFELVCGKSRLTMDAAGNITLAGTKIAVTAEGPVAIDGSVIDLN